MYDLEKPLTITTLLSHSADDKLMIFFLFFPEKKKIWYFMQTVSIGDNLQDTSNPVFEGKIRKTVQYVVCWKSYSEC